MPIRRALVLCLVLAATARAVDDPLAGDLRCLGSDTMAELVTAWSERFHDLHPGVAVQIEARGSSTAPPALIGGSGDVGPMSRELRPDEERAFEKRFGRPATALKVAMDTIAVFVHPTNHLAGLTLRQLDGVFSQGRLRGGDDISRWSDLGGTPRPIALYGRNSASGTYAFFKEHALCKGDYKPVMQEQAGSAAVIAKVAADVDGIGYCGIGYVTNGVRSLAIGEDAQHLVTPTAEHALDGSYPLARYLYLVIPRRPGQPPAAIADAFVRFALSPEGQEIVRRQGYFTLPAPVVTAQVALLAP